MTDALTSLVKEADDLPPPPSQSGSDSGSGGPVLRMYFESIQVRQGSLLVACCWCVCSYQPAHLPACPSVCPSVCLPAFLFIQPSSSSFLPHSLLSCPPPQSYVDAKNLVEKRMQQARAREAERAQQQQQQQQPSSQTQRQQRQGQGLGLSMNMSEQMVTQAQELLCEGLSGVSMQQEEGEGGKGGGRRQSKLSGMRYSSLSCHDAVVTLRCCLLPLQLTN
jgi:hypothetical protein